MEFWRRREDVGVDGLDLDLVGPFKQAQQKLEGSKYITGSMVIPMLEEIRDNLRSARMHYSAEQSPLGSVVVDAVIEAFNVRFGDGTEICVLKEGPARLHARAGGGDLSRRAKCALSTWYPAYAAAAGMGSGPKLARRPRPQGARGEVGSSP